MQEFSESSRLNGKTIALVPTMGFFHEGHIKLMEEGKKRADILMISIFVNPTQFSVGEDFEKYPRDWERDKKMAEGAGVDVIFAPSALDMYPNGYQTYVNVEEVTKNLCGMARPTHFRGVTTVVAKLFLIMKPHIAIFGEKDFQQLATIRRMVKDLNFDIEIVGFPTVREEDGLAMSSRNTYLSSEERQSALSLSQSLQLAKKRVAEGIKDANTIVEEVSTFIGAHPYTKKDYVALCHPETLEEIQRVANPSLLALAVWVGKTRLIDNAILTP